jgi:predicted transcriptional regulator of viral defense system
MAGTTTMTPGLIQTMTVDDKLNFLVREVSHLKALLDKDDRLFTYKEVQERLGIGRKMVKKLVNEGLLEERLVGRKLLKVTAASLTRYLAGQRETTR